MTPTTRRYPRTMAEAFPHDAGYACAIEHHRVVRPTGPLLALAVLALLLIWSVL